MAFVSIKDFTTGLAAKLRTFLVNTDENVTVHGLVDSANGEILGTKTDAANTATDNTSLSFMQVLKQVSASDQAAATVAGAAGDAAVAAGATGSLSAKLRAISRDLVANIVLAAGTAIIGKVGIDQTTDGTTNKVAAALRVGANAIDTGPGTGGTATPRMALDTSQVASVLDCSTTVTRPADTNAYTANDAFSNSTSAPTAGGFTFTSAAASSGGGGIITDAVIVASAGTLYQGEIWIFDGAVAAINDNAAFALSDADALLALGKIPFTLAVEAGNNSSAHVSGLNIGFHCIGSANLRFLIKILNAPTPGNGETLTVRIKGIRS